MPALAVLQDPHSGHNTRNANGWLSTGQDAGSFLACVVSEGPVINSRGDDVTRQRPVRLVAGLAVVAALLCGCSEKQPAKDTLPTQSAAETTPELPPLGPEALPVPPEAREKTPEGALAFAKYYMTLGTEIGHGDIPSQFLLDLSTPECRLCAQVAASFAEDQAAGYKHVGSSHTFEEYALPRISGDTAELGFVYSQSAYTVVDDNGQDIPAEAAPASGELQSGMLLEWRSDLSCWLVSNLTIG